MIVKSIIQWTSNDSNVSLVELKEFPVRRFVKLLCACKKPTCWRTLRRRWRNTRSLWWWLGSSGHSSRSRADLNSRHWFYTSVLLLLIISTKFAIYEQKTFASHSLISKSSFLALEIHRMLHKELRWQTGEHFLVEQFEEVYAERQRVARHEHCNIGQQSQPKRYQSHAPLYHGSLLDVLRLMLTQIYLLSKLFVNAFRRWSQVLSSYLDSLPMKI